MDFVKWAVILSSLAFGLALLAVVVYILTPLLINVLTGTSGACETPAYSSSGTGNLQASLYNLCSTTKAFLGATAMILIILSSPLIFISNALVSFEIFAAKSESSPKVLWLAIVWAIPTIGGLAYLFKGRKNFRPA